MCEQEATNKDYDNDSDASDASKYNSSNLFEDNNAANDTDKTTNRDSSYNTNKIGVTMTEDTDSCYTTKINKFKEAI